MLLRQTSLNSQSAVQRIVAVVATVAAIISATFAATMHRIRRCCNRVAWNRKSYPEIPWYRYTAVFRDDVGYEISYWQVHVSAIHAPFPFSSYEPRCANVVAIVDVLSKMLSGRTDRRRWHNCHSWMSHVWQQTVTRQQFFYREFFVYFIIFLLSFILFLLSLCVPRVRFLY